MTRNFRTGSETDTSYKLRQLFVRNQNCEIFPTTSRFVRQWILRQAGLCEMYSTTVFSTTSTIVRQAGLCEIYSTTDFSTTSTFVRQFLVRQGFLCDKLFCATSFFVRQAIFTVNGELRRERRSGKNTTGMVNLFLRPFAAEFLRLFTNFYDFLRACR